MNTVGPKSSVRRAVLQRDSAYPVYNAHYPTYGHAAALQPQDWNLRTWPVAYGPYGAVGAAQTYNPRTRAFRQTSAGSRDRSTNVRTLFARNNRARCDFVGEQHEEVSCP